MRPGATSALAAALAPAGSGSVLGASMWWDAGILLAYRIGHSLPRLAAGAEPLRGAAGNGRGLENHPRSGNRGLMKPPDPSESMKAPMPDPGIPKMTFDVVSVRPSARANESPTGDSTNSVPAVTARANHAL